MAHPMLRIFHGIPVPAKIVTETVAVLAVRGVGKTYFMLKETELFLELSIQVCWIDAMGVASGLRSSADGKKTGYSITILGGDHADIPLVPTAGAVVAEFIASNPSFSCILDISDWRKGERKRFVTEFMEELFHRKKKQRSPLHLFLDEVDYWAPQKPEDNLDPRMLGALDDIVRRGRIYGIGATFATQRSQVVNKNLLSQVSVLVMMRTNSDSDLEIFLKWAKRNATKEQIQEVVNGIDKLETGHAWVLSPYFLKIFGKAKILERTTFDSSKTPELGETIIQPKNLAPVDLAKITTAIEVSGQLVQSEDPKVLKARIRELEGQVRAMPKVVVQPKAPEVKPKEVIKKIIQEKAVKVELPAISAGDMKRIESISIGINEATKKLDTIINGVLQGVAKKVKEGEDLFNRINLENLKKNPLEFVQKHMDPRPDPLIGSRPIFAPKAPQRAPSPSLKPQVSLDGVKLKTGELAILAAFCRWFPNDVTHERVGLLTGYIGSTYETYANRLRRFALLNSGPKTARASDKGMAYVEAQGTVPPLPASFDDVVKMWQGKLKTGEACLLNAIAYTEGPISLEDWGQKAGVTNPDTLQTYSNRLRRFDLVKKREDELWERNDQML